MGFGLVIFDCNGVLVDSERLVNAIEASYFTDLGYPMSADEARSRFKGKTMVDVALAVESAVGDGLRRDWRSPSRGATSGAIIETSKVVLNLSVATTFVPKGTPIAVHTMSGHHSYGAHPGERIRYEVDQDVIVNGAVIANAGDTAYGQVEESQHGNELPFLNDGSLLGVSVEEILSFCGDTIYVDFDRSEYRTSHLGFFLSNKDVTIAKGQQYLAETDRPQRVCGEPTTATDPPPAN